MDAQGSHGAQATGGDGTDGGDARLARDMYQGLAQGLETVAFLLSSAETLLEEGSRIAQARALVSQARTQTYTNLDDLQRTMLDLRAAPIARGTGLANGLRHLVDEWRRQSGRDVHFSAEGQPASVPARVEVGLYGIAQEALANAARHADASHIAVRLNHRADSVGLVIADDGRGFDPRRATGGGSGLLRMNERAHLLGGRFRLRSAPGQGTSVEVDVPI
jgi:two-component system NarL family sensor kinase